MSPLFTEYQANAKRAVADSIARGLVVDTNFSDSQISERIARIGVEARAFAADGIDDYEKLARATLLNDAAKYAVAR